jgi:hypothetical protein
MLNKILTTLLAGVLLSFVTDNHKENNLTSLTPEKKYTLTEGEAQMLSSAMAVSKQVIFPTSQTPAIQVTQVNNIFDSIQTVLVKQFKQFQAQDSVKKK